MRIKTGITALMVVVALFWMSSFAFAGYITARVDRGSGAIQAKIVPSEFTIPSGNQAVNLKYNWSDPKSGRSSKKLGKNIYSITQGIYMVDGNGNPLAALPPGKYRFFVGGSPGARGSLSYTTVPTQ
jgi:hypothetical protein